MTHDKSSSHTTIWEYKQSYHNHNSYMINQQCKQDSRKDVIPSKIWLFKSQRQEMKNIFLLLEIKKMKNNKEIKSYFYKWMSPNIFLNGAKPP